MATIDVTEDTFNDTVSSEGIVLVDAWATWCGPCKSFAPIYEKASEKHEEVKFTKLDVDANPGVSAALEISAVPTLFFFRDGIGVYRQSGVMNPAQLDDTLEQIKALDMDEVRRQVAAQNAEADAQEAQEDKA
ncbi:Putative thioredoxin-2 [Corynebacterium occultum]|uniref:Thioredoxin n=1 Tax=Corynebacterium occultum TaxID=2675219 RepID=A0A6B8WBC4_9CORY|nr:thioredoxin [Corynebacterium occultum]QGU08605.1 Putative thioredoxin-2 [Corynebacterium occultum]